MPFIPDDLRDKHIYLPGNSGQGKTTTMLAQAKQDIDAGRGVTYIDPSGDAVEKLIHWIPESRKNDTIWLSLRNKIPLNFMSYDPNDQLQKERVVGDLIYILEKDPSHTPRMVPLLRDVIYSFIDLPDRTFLDIYRFFTDPVRQAEILRQTTDKLRLRWKKMPSDAILEPLLSRMEIYERIPTLNAIFGTPFPNLNIPEVMRLNQILLVDLDDSEAGKLLGQLLVAQFKRAAFARRDTPEADRIPYCLYCDEFQEFQMPEFEKIINQGRKYQIWLTLANQGLYQLDEKIRQAVMRTGTKILFNLPPEDARAFKYCTSDDLPDISSLEQYQAIYKIGSSPAVLSEIPPPAPFCENSYADDIRIQTTINYDPFLFAESPKIRTVDESPFQFIERMFESREDESTRPKDPDASEPGPTFPCDKPTRKRPRKPRKK